MMQSSFDAQTSAENQAVHSLSMTEQDSLPRARVPDSE